MILRLDEKLIANECFYYIYSFIDLISISNTSVVRYVTTFMIYLFQNYDYNFPIHAYFDYGMTNNFKTLLCAIRLTPKIIEI
jgi:hypothetical protein